MEASKPVVGSVHQYNVWIPTSVYLNWTVELALPLQQFVPHHVSRLVHLQWKSFTLTARRSNRTLILCTQALELYVKTICPALLSPSFSAEITKFTGAEPIIFFCTRAMVLLEKFVGVSRDAGMDGRLHKTRTIIMDYIADVRISRQAYFCSLGCTVIWPSRHFVYNCSIGYILPPRKLPWTKIIEHILCSTIARVEKYNNCRINLLFSAENEGLSSARQVVLHTVTGRKGWLRMVFRVSV